jgi:Tol biopolymer transport system component
MLVRPTSPSESTLWLVDLAHGGASPISSARGRNDYPVWSPDGTRILYSEDKDGPQDLFVKTLDGTSPEQPFFRSDVLFKQPLAWSNDGKWVVESELDPGTKQNVYLLPASGSGRLQPIATTSAREQGGWPSPDGRWVAYASDETGRLELFVQSFPVPGEKVQVSREGAQSAWWTRDGRQLLFVADDFRSLWRVDVKPGQALDVGEPKRIAFLPPDIVSIDATPDRQRFLALSPERTGTGSITVVQNWRAALGPGR